MTTTSWILVFMALLHAAEISCLFLIARVLDEKVIEGDRA